MRKTFIYLLISFFYFPLPINALEGTLADAEEAMSTQEEINKDILYFSTILSSISSLNDLDSLFFDYIDSSKQLAKSGNYALASNHGFKMLSLLDELLINKPQDSETIKKYILVYDLIGYCYGRLENNEKTREYFNLELESINQLDSVEFSSFVRERKSAVYNNIASSYLADKNYPHAGNLYEKALAYSDTDSVVASLAILYNNLGIVNLNTDNSKQAFDYTQRSLKIWEILKDTTGMAQVYNNLGNYYLALDDRANALKSFEQALSLSRKASAIKSEMLATKALAFLYKELGLYEKALIHSELGYQLQDSVMGQDLMRQVSRQELQYQHEKLLKEVEFKSLMDAAHHEKMLWVILSIGIFIFFLLIISVLLYRNQRGKAVRSKLAQKNLEQEKQILLLEKKQLTQDIEYKKKEIASFAISLANKNEFMESVKEKLLNIESDNKKNDHLQIDRIIREVNSNLDKTTWAEFDLRFKEVYSDFYNELLARFPSITPNELKICAFLRLNMTTKDISAITFQSERSIEVARTRLRKKLNLERKDNLITFLQKL